MTRESRPLLPRTGTALSTVDPPAVSVSSSDPPLRLEIVPGPSIPIESVVPLSTPEEPLEFETDWQEERADGSWKHAILGFRNRLGGFILRPGLENDRFTVLSNDCWGQALYEGYGLPCQTPLIGGGMHADCFLRFLGNIEGYLASPLRFIPETRYAAVRRLRKQRVPWPIALLGEDVEVHFMHYRSEAASRRAWDLGCERLNLDRIAVKFTSDKDGATQEHVERFAALPFERKLLISRRSHPTIACAVQTPDFLINGAMMFRRSLKYFDCTHWLNTGQVVTNTPRVWVNKLIYAKGV